MLVQITRAAIPLASPAATGVDPVIEALVNLTPDYSAGGRLHALYVNRLQSALPGNYSQMFGTGPAFRGIFFPGWQPDPLLPLTDQTGLDGSWWSGFSTAVLCQAIQELADHIRGQMLADKINSDVASANTTLRSRSALPYARVLAGTFEPLAALLRQVNPATAKAQFHDSLLANVLNRQLWYQAGMWVSPDWEMFNQYAKYLALGATPGEVDTLITQLREAGLPVPDQVREGAWLGYAEQLRDRPFVTAEDIRPGSAAPIIASTWLPTPRGMPAQMPNGNCYEFTARSQPGNPYRRPPGGSCFTGDTQVLLADGQPVPLRRLRPGDTVATRDGTGTVAYLGQPLRGDRRLYRIGRDGPVFAGTHPFVNAATAPVGTPAPALLALEPQALTATVPTLSQDGVGTLAPGSRLLSRGPGTPAPPVTATVEEITTVTPGPDDTYLYDVHLTPQDGQRQEFWAGQSGMFYLTTPEFPVIEQAGPAAVTLVALTEGLLASGGPAQAGWPDWIAAAINQFGPGIFHSALAEALATTPAFGAPPPPAPLDTRIQRLFTSLAGATGPAAAVISSLFDGQLAALGQWLSSVVALGWRAPAEPGGTVLAVGVFDLTLTPTAHIPPGHDLCLTVTAHGQAGTDSARMWDHRGRANTPFHRVFDQLTHVDLAGDQLTQLTFTGTVNESPLPLLIARVPQTVGGPARALGSAVLRDPLGNPVGQIRYDTRQLGRATATQEITASGRWTEQAAQAYANALGTAMIQPTLARLTALTPTPA